MDNGQLTVRIKPNSVEFVRGTSGNWKLTGIIEHDSTTDNLTEIYLVGTRWSACKKGFGVLTETTGNAGHSLAPMFVAHGGSNMGSTIFDYLCSLGNILKQPNSGPGASKGSGK